LLSEIPGADLAKLRTFESCSWEIAPGEIPASVDFAFIDGEHTTLAVIRDFESVRRHMSKASVIAFHDCFIVSTALLRILKTLESERTDHRSLHYPGSAVIAIVFGSEEITGILLNSGWSPKIPITRLHSIKMWASRHVPSVRPLWRLIQKILP
ncbi:MAG TPA: class I SAM-dependent methyltransferase, partial [Roseimicrobium sp.]|nr:class I SAM-dependent methyltransferase [Roseimicrobium sp.]